MSIPIIAGLRCRCPECGDGRLFGKFLEIEPCGACGLDLREANPGDGLSTLVFLLVGGLGCWGIVWSERAFNPPAWLLILLWLPLIGWLSLVTLQPFKGVMVALLYRTQAIEAVSRMRQKTASAGASSGRDPSENHASQPSKAGPAGSARGRP